MQSIQTQSLTENSKHKAHLQSQSYNLTIPCTAKIPLITDQLFKINKLKLKHPSKVWNV
jgi:hypothetical protein